MTGMVFVCALVMISGAWARNDEKITVRLVNSARVADATLSPGKQQVEAGDRRRQSDGDCRDHGDEQPASDAARKRDAAHRIA